MSAKVKVLTALDRPHLRWAIGPAATAFVSLGKRRPCIVHAEGPLWIHRYSDAILPQPAIGGDDPGGREAKARDDFFFDYEPRTGDTIVDVGAGIGGETLTFSRLVGNEGRVISIEGHPATAHALRRLVELNDLTNVTVLQVAVGREPGLVFMSNDTEDHLANSIRGDVLTDPPVPLLRLDDIVTDLGLGHIDFLKMNIEGAELDALAGVTDSRS